MRYLSLFVFLVVIVFSGCQRPMPKDDDNDRDGDTEESSSSNSGTTRPSSQSGASSDAASMQGKNIVTVGNDHYSVIETSEGFAVLRLGSNSQEILEQVNYTASGSMSLASPRITETRADGFTVSFRATSSGSTDTETVTYRIATEPLRVE